jgi:hypothetical protein
MSQRPTVRMRSPRFNNIYCEPYRGLPQNLLSSKVMISSPGTGRLARANLLSKSWALSVAVLLPTIEASVVLSYSEVLSDSRHCYDETNFSYL